MCIDDQMLSSYLDGDLKEPYCTQVREHLGYCQACRERLNDFKRLSEDIKALKVDEGTLLRNKDRIYSRLEEKYFLSDKKKSFMRRKIEMSLPSLITAAAAVVFIFVGGFMFFGSNDVQTEQILPSFSVHADSSNVQFVSHKTSSLEQYSLEEILEYLDSKGYDVDISIRGIEKVD